MLFQRILILLVLASISLGTYAQNTSSISGYVYDNNEAIAGVSVTIDGSSAGTTTNSNGYYELKNLGAGNYTITVSFIGYTKQSKQISLNAAQELRLDFILTGDAQQLNDVAITGRTEAQVTRASGFTVNAIETRNFANANVDLNQVLNRSTGVKVREQGGVGSDFNFSINGLSG